MKMRISSYVKLVIYLSTFCLLYASTNENISTDAVVTVSETKRVAITFDDGPHSIYTEMLLDGLKERDVVATFFVIGVNIEGNENVIKRISDEGHLIGNHTYSHENICDCSQNQLDDEIDKTNVLIKNITGKDVKYIRPPFGNCKEKSIKNMTVVLWNVDPRDWCITDENVVVKNIVDNVSDGDIILLHDIFKSSVNAALKTIDILKEQGYEFVTIEELFS